MTVAAERVRAENAAPVRPERDLVLYWMTAARRVRWNPDDFPECGVPEAIRAAARSLDVRLEAVDGSCLVPFRHAGKDHPSAYLPALPPARAADVPRPPAGGGSPRAGPPAPPRRAPRRDPPPLAAGAA